MIWTGAFSLVFVGVLDYRANIDGLRWFCNEVWPRVRQRLPDLKLNLVGRRPGRPARQLAEITRRPHSLAKYPDVRPYVCHADAVIAPLNIARGVQNKVLEALALGKPVIATPQAIKGTSARHGEHILSAASAEEWVEAIETLFHNRDLRRRLGRTARSLIERDYHWSARLRQLASFMNLDHTHVSHRSDQQPVTS